MDKVDTFRFYKYVTDVDKLTKINIVTKELFELRILIENVKAKWFKSYKLIFWYTIEFGYNERI